MRRLAVSNPLTPVFSGRLSSPFFFRPGSLYRLHIGFERYGFTTTCYTISNIENHFDWRANSLSQNKVIPYLIS